MGVINVLFQDCQHLTEVVLQILFYVTPILYKPEMLQKKGLDWFIHLNPLAVMFDLLRQPILEGASALVGELRRRTPGREHRRGGRRAHPPALRAADDLLSLAYGATCCMPLVELEDVGLLFRVRCHGRVSLKEYLLHGLFRPSKKNILVVQALEHIDLQIDEGDRLGIVGHNGAGKSTLLSSWPASIRPRPACGPFAGRSARSSTSLWGLSSRPAAGKTSCTGVTCRGKARDRSGRKCSPSPNSATWASFSDMPVRYYSAGMLVRLAFSIATAIEPEILIVDEVLGAGDISFLNKARQRMKDLITSPRAVVIVSHDLTSLATLCDKVLWLDRGKIA